MKVEGYKVQGFTFAGKRTLQSIGKLAFLHDYRNTRRFATGLSTVYDLSGNGLDLQYTANTATVLYADGWGNPATTWQMNYSGDYQKLRFVFDGSAFAYYLVFYNNDASPLGIFNGLALSTASRAFGVDQNTANKRARALFPDGTANNGVTGSMPSDRPFLCRFIFYGSGATAPNFKMVLETATSNFTRTTGFVTPGGDIGRPFQRQGNGNSHRVKFDCAYDFTGKTKAEIDAIDAEFITLLKSDSAYSSLIT